MGRACVSARRQRAASGGNRPRRPGTLTLTPTLTLTLALALALAQPGMLTDRPFMRPFWGLVGDFDTTTIADYYPEAGFKGMIGDQLYLLWLQGDDR